MRNMKMAVTESVLGILSVITVHSQQLRNLCRSQNLAMLIHATVTLKLDYNNMLHLGQPLKTIQKLHLEQNFTACILLGAGWNVQF